MKVHIVIKKNHLTLLLNGFFNHYYLIKKIITPFYLYNSMNKSINMFDDLIDKVKLGLKTQTIRLIKLNSANTIDFQTQFEECLITKSDYNNFPLIQSVLNESKYLKGDILTIDNSKTVIKILSVRISTMLNVTAKELEKEGIKSQSYSKTTNRLIYFDYITESYTLNTISDSYKTLMEKCYGSTVFQNNPFVFIYEFKVVR